MLISINEYAKMHGKAHGSVQQKAIRGNFKTARKIGRNWVIDSEEPYVDGRIKSGNYKDFRKNMIDKREKKQQENKTPSMEDIIG